MISSDLTKIQNQVYTDIVSLPEEKILSRSNKLISASKTGLIFCFHRESLFVPEKQLKKFLNQQVELFLSHYELVFYGVIKSICLYRKDIFQIEIDFTESTPLYYRECVEDLLN